MKQQFIMQYSALLTTIKSSLIHILMIIVAFLAPIKALILTVGACIVLDTITGLIKARKNKDKITSRKLSHVITKMVLYQSAIILFFCIEKHILADFIVLFTGINLFLTKIVACVLVGIELMSCNENYLAISGVSIWGKFKELLRRAKEVKEEVKDLTEEPNGKTDI